jgi:FkbM family methyltransferase
MKMSWHKRFSRTLRGRFRRKILGRTGVGVCAQTWNGVFLVDPGDFVVSRLLLEKGEYDRDEVEWLRGMLKPDSSTLVIVGTHLGAVLVPLAKHARKVIGFEPNPPTYKLARLNVLLNQLSNVTLENIAAGATEGFTKVINNPINTGNARVSEVTASADSDSTRIVTLDSYMAAGNVGPIDLLIVDIEGHELHALRGATATLAQTEKLYVEYAPEQLREHTTNPADLVELLTGRFPYMYIPGRPAQEFSAVKAREYLLSLPPRKGLLLNLLFSKQPMSR